MRSSIRRAKQVRFRRERVPVEVPPDDSAAAQAADDEREAEKIEVHVHLHRGEGSKRSRSRRPAPPVLTGALFDWQWYKERLVRKPAQAVDRSWSLATSCQACGSTIPSMARRCPRCAAPRARQSVLRIVMALLGVVSIAVVFALGVRVLGGSVPERQASAPLGQWTDDDFVVVQVPATPSPFSSASPSPSAAGAAPSSSGLGAP